MNGPRTLRIVFTLLLLTPLALFAIGTGHTSSGASASSSATSMTADDYYNAGVTLSDAGKHSEALVQFQKAVAARSDFADAYNMIGFTYRMLGNIHLSLQNYEKALALKPDFPQAHEYLGETYLAAGDLLHAMQNYLILKNAGRTEAGELWDKIASFVDEKTQSVAAR